MKTSKYQVLKPSHSVSSCSPPRTGKAQVFPNSYINVDWQVGVPLGSSLADKASGWGMNFEGGYFITPAIAVGPFISYQTNLETIPRQTLDLGNGSALTVNQKHSVFQLPFGVTSRYTWLTDSVFQPICGPEAGCQLRRAFVLLLRRQAVQRHVGILPLARNRREHLPAPRLPFRVPCGTLLQLCHQQR